MSTTSEQDHESGTLKLTSHHSTRNSQSETDRRSELRRSYAPSSQECEDKLYVMHTPLKERYRYLIEEKYKENIRKENK